MKFVENCSEDLLGEHQLVPSPLDFSLSLYLLELDHILSLPLLDDAPSMHQEVLKFEFLMVLQLPSLMSIYNSHLEFLGPDGSVDINFLRLREVAHILRDIVFLFFL